MWEGQGDDVGAYFHIQQRIFSPEKKTVPFQLQAVFSENGIRNFWNIKNIQCPA